MGKRKIGNLWEVIDLKQKETFLCIDLKCYNKVVTEVANKI